MAQPTDIFEVSAIGLLFLNEAFYSNTPVVEFKKTKNAYRPKLYGPKFFRFCIVKFEKHWAKRRRIWDRNVMSHKNTRLTGD